MELKALDYRGCLQGCQLNVMSSVKRAAEDADTF